MSDGSSDRAAPTPDTAPGMDIAVPELLCYPLEPDPPAIEPAPAARDWMDRTDRRYAYRCLLAARDPDAVAQGWQRHYMRGEDAAGRRAGFHLTKRRVKPFKPETER